MKDTIVMKNHMSGAQAVRRPSAPINPNLRQNPAPQNRPSQARPQNAAAARPTAAKKVNSAAKNKSQNLNIADIIDKVRFICHFLPIISTLIIILNLTVTMPNFLVDYFFVPLTFVGWIAAIIARPVEIIKAVLAVPLKVFAFIMLFPFIFISFPTALGTSIAVFGCMILLFIFAPAAYTIYFLLKE